MFSSLGLHDWELIVASGLCAVFALAVSAVIGAFTAYIVLREPAPATARVKVTPRPMEMEARTPIVVREPALAAG